MSTSRTASPVVWAPLSPDKTDWVYSADAQTDAQRRCIGHLRGDFGDGSEFWTSWFTHDPSLMSDAFTSEVNQLVKALRVKGALLHDFAAMRRLCGAGTPVEDCFGFQTETELALYCLRCIPQRGGYHFYLYAYNKA